MTAIIETSLFDQKIYCGSVEVAAVLLKGFFVVRMHGSRSADVFSRDICWWHIADEGKPAEHVREMHAGVSNMDSERPKADLKTEPCLTFFYPDHLRDYKRQLGGTT